MTKQLGSEANKPNPALASLARVVGSWTMVGTHPMVPDTVFHGKATFEWIEGGAFLMTRTEIDEPQIPSGIAIIGSDNELGTLAMIYFDERGVSRRYEMSMDGDVLSWWRDSPKLAQRFTCTLSDDGRTMVGKGMMSKDGGAWEGDLELTYTRVE